MYQPSRPGASKHGPALLAGILRCRRCGRKRTVQYDAADPENRLVATNRRRAGTGRAAHRAQPASMNRDSFAVRLLDHGGLCPMLKEIEVSRTTFKHTNDESLARHTALQLSLHNVGH
jgi:hypothetical protein